MMRMLVLRPEPGASATVAKARERGLDAVVMPLFTVEPVAWEAPETPGIMQEAGHLGRPSLGQFLGTFSG